MENHKRGQANDGTDENNVTVHVPMTFGNRGGRKLVVVPRDAPQRPPQRSIESPLAKAIVRAFHWKRLLEAGEYTTLAELGSVEAILDGTEHGDLQIERLLKPFSVEWEEQRQLLIGSSLQ